MLVIGQEGDKHLAEWDTQKRSAPGSCVRLKSSLNKKCGKGFFAAINSAIPAIWLLTIIQISPIDANSKSIATALHVRVSILAHTANCSLGKVSP